MIYIIYFLGILIIIGLIIFALKSLHDIIYSADMVDLAASIIAFSLITLLIIFAIRFLFSFKL